MTKRQMIDEILTMNRSAEPGFLARFDDGDLSEYLQHLQLARTPRLSGNRSRYDKYFVNVPTISARPRPRADVLDDLPLPAPAATAHPGAAVNADEASPLLPGWRRQTADPVPY